MYNAVNKLKETVIGVRDEEGFKGKIINVVNQLPYNCILNLSNTNQSILDKIKQLKLQRNPFNVYSEITPAHTPTEEHDLNPISHIQRRRSTITVNRTNNWRLTQRRGHSAMYAAIDSLKKDYQTLYIGGTGSIFTDENDPIEVNDINEEERDSLTSLLLSKYDMLPIFVEDKLASGHYEGYSKQVLWPLMHYLMWSDNVDEIAFWKDYVKVNEIFAQEAINHYNDGDIIWVHDYHLFLVPQMIRERLPDARVGLFIHTPFPSSEIFRCLPHRREVLQGILGANLIGLQTYDYARHFTSCCTRLLGYEYTPAGILGQGSLVQIGIYPIGIDLERTRDHCNRPGVEPKAKAIRERYAGKKLIIGRDKLDRVKGVLQKLEAFEIFLDTYPEWRDKVVLIQVTSPGVLDTPDLEKKANEIVARVNSKYGSLEFSPANLFNQHIDRDEYYALLKVADIGLVTPVIDGMNTSSFEYIVAQEGHHSPLILSEFTGTARSMSAAIIVNPWNFNEVARAIAECLSMSEEEKKIKYEQLSQFVTSHTASFWARSLVKGLLDTKKSNWGTTAPLDVSRVKVEYDNSSKRALFFDYDGTLVPIHTNPEDAKPSERAIEVLKKLCENPQNVVWVVSGRTQEWLDRYLGHIPNLGLSAEHGCFIKDPQSSTWTNTAENLDFSWKDGVKEVFEYYTERTPGSTVEEKECCIVWHYRKADPKFGAFQAMECQNHIEQNFVGKQPIECLPNKMNVEVRHSLINKGSVVNRVVAQNHTIDFVLCVGDDKTDEDMFRTLERIQASGTEVVQFIVIVGSHERKTLAKWRLESSTKFLDLLNLLLQE